MSGFHGAALTITDADGCITTVELQGDDGGWMLTTGEACDRNASAVAVTSGDIIELGHAMKIVEGHSEAAARRDAN